MRWCRTVAGVKLAYQIHAVAFGMVMVLLVLIWMAAGFGYPWPIWPAITWGPFVGLEGARGVTVLGSRCCSR